MKVEIVKLDDFGLGICFVNNKVTFVPNTIPGDTVNIKIVKENKKYNLTQNQGFLICPDTLTYYEADKTNPWTYIWIGFNGLKAKSYLENADLNRENLIFNYVKKPNALKLYIDEILKLKNINFLNIKIGA
mgnify:CR=1 FL=1